MKYKRYMIIMCIIVIVLNAVAWLSPALCDWYTDYIFQIWVELFAGLTNLVPFSVGEVMILAGILLVLAAIFLGICCIFLRKKKKFIRGAVKFYKVFGIILVNLGLVLTLNFTVLYHCTPLDANVNKDDRVYLISELEILRNYVVEQCNYYAGLMERDENGDVVYYGDMQKTSKEALKGIASEYPKLLGYYPDVKYIYFSDIMSQAYIAGIYFPFSLEANCNANMYITNYPLVFCHELVHLQGYIFEDEAGFLSYLACISSEDVFFRYSAYLEALNYVDSAYIDSIIITGDKEEWERYGSQPVITDEVYHDCIFLKEEMWEEVEEDSFISTDVMDEISTTVMDANLKVNGVEEGIAAYGGIVELMLQYYDGILY